MIISLKKTLSVGDMGIIYLMQWSPESNETDDPRKYFSVYYSMKYLENSESWSSSKGFAAEIDSNGLVKKNSAIHMILTDYIKDQLAGKNYMIGKVNNKSEKFEQHLFTEPEDAIFDVFKKLYNEKMFKD